MSKMKLLISFNDCPEDFVQGTEFGRIFEKIERGDDEVCNNGFPVRLQNQELIHQACKVYDYTSQFSECTTKGWVNFKSN